MEKERADSLAKAEKLSFKTRWAHKLKDKTEKLY